MPGVSGAALTRLRRFWIPSESLSISSSSPVRAPLRSYSASDSPWWSASTMRCDPTARSMRSGASSKSTFAAAAYVGATIKARSLRVTTCGRRRENTPGNYHCPLRPPRTGGCGAIVRAYLSGPASIGWLTRGVRVYRTVRINGFLLALVVSAFEIVGCGSSAPASGGPGSTLGLSLRSTAVTVDQGGTATVQIDLTRTSYQRAVTITLAGLEAAGIIADPLVIDSSSVTGTLRLHASATAAVGTANGT